jgi:hypothetical protein
MGRGNWIKRTAIISVLAFGFAITAGAEMSIGEAIFKFVTSSFLGDAFGSISNAGSAVIKSAAKLLPIPDIKDLLDKLKLTVMILRVLKAVKAPENIDIGEFLSIVKKLAGTGASMEEISAELGRISLSVADGLKGAPLDEGSLPGLNTGAGLNITEENTGLNLGAEASLGVESVSLLPSATGSLGLSAPGGLNSGDDDLGLASGTSGADETDPGAIISVIEKFLKLIQDNADFIEQAGSLVDSLDAAANPDALKQRIAGYFDSQAAPIMEKYGISGSDISTAEDLVNGKYSSDMEKIRSIVSLLGRGSSTIATFDQLLEIYDSLNGRTELSRDKAVEVLIKIVKLMPDTAGAIGTMAGGK